jgi:hypothetical protein
MTFVGFVGNRLMLRATRGCCVARTVEALAIEVCLYSRVREQISSADVSRCFEPVKYHHDNALRPTLS